MVQIFVCAPHDQKKRQQHICLKEFQDQIMYEVHGEVSTFDFTQSDGAGAMADFDNRCFPKLTEGV